MLVGHASCVINGCPVSSYLFVGFPAGNGATDGVATGEGDYLTGDATAGAVKCLTGDSRECFMRDGGE